MRKGRRQEVTGIVVNEKLNVDRATLKRFRALLFQIEKDGPEGKHWNGTPNLLAAIHGYASFVYMVNPQKGAALLKQTKRILKKQAWKQKVPHPEKTPPKPPKKKPWWKFWARWVRA
jgi:RNA-directed DNA polymerase